MVEPWLRGTLGEVDALRRQVMHALQLAGEDAARWCAPLSGEQMHARPCGLASVGFHLCHIAGSLDRLLTYAEAGQLTPDQLAVLGQEQHASGSAAQILAEFLSALDRAAERVRCFSSEQYEERRFVGRQRLPTTLGGLLIHCAEHTQRHIGQAITTAQIVAAPGFSIGPIPSTPE